MRRGLKIGASALAVLLLVAAYTENNISPGTITSSPDELIVGESGMVSLSGASDMDQMETSVPDSISTVTWSSDLDVTFYPSVGMSASATVNSLPSGTADSVVEVDMTITAVVDDAAAYVDDGPASTLKAGKAKDKHRGRIQIQGNDLAQEVSWPWAQDTPPTKQDMLTQLDNLYNGLTQKQKDIRSDAYTKAKAYINGLPAGGADAAVSKTWQNKGTNTERIDLEIKKGKAGTG